MSNYYTKEEVIELLPDISNLLPDISNSEVQPVVDNQQNEEVIETILDKNPGLTNVYELEDIFVNEKDDPINDVDFAQKKNALIKAVTSGNLIQFRELIKDHHLLRNLTTILDNEGVNIIHIATIYGHVDILTEVLQLAKSTEGIDIRQFVEAKCDFGRTALDQAIRNKNLEAVKCLLEYGATVDIGTMCDAAIESTSSNSSGQEFARELIKLCGPNGDNVRFNTNDKNIILHVAAISSEWEVVKSLVEVEGADINSIRYGYPILQHAARQQNLEMISWLIEHGADVNGKDHLGRFLIQQEHGFDVLLHLLSSGASLANKSIWSGLAINSNISSHLLHTHLDNCIKEHRRDRRILYIDCKTLLPTDSGSLPESEIDIPYYISQNKDLRGFLKHPVILTFLMLKWSKIKWFYFINLIFFTSLCVKLLIYIFVYYNNNTHGIVEKCFYVALIIDFILLLIREIFQIRINYKKYITSIENYVEIGLLIVMLIIFCSNSTTNDKLRKHVSAISFLCMSFSLTLLFGQHPSLAANIIMLRTVTYNFFIYFVIYSAILLSFGLSFFVLFSDEDMATEDDNDQIHFFRNPFMTFFKALVMMTGELNASDINNNQFTLVAIIIFTLFVFMIPIIILNLLNGLAVSDTQRIRDEAEILGYVSQTEFIAYIERLFLTGKLSSTLRLSNVIGSIIERVSEKKFKSFFYLLFYSNKKKEARNKVIILYSNDSAYKEFYERCEIKYFSNDVVAEAHAILRKKREQERINESRNKKFEDLQSRMQKMDDRLDKTMEVLENVNSTLRDSLIAFNKTRSGEIKSDDSES